jgi:phosphatidylglycerophosphatase A
MGSELYLLSVVALCALGVWASDIAERRFGKSDDGRIVIDEVVGQLLALTPLVVLSRIDVLALRPQWTADPDPGAIIWFSLVVTAFVAFRVFDIWKPGAVGWAEKRFKGGVGVMADDVVAGVLAAVVVTVPAYVAVIYRLQSATGLPA